jgi:hypothetical protein
MTYEIMVTLNENDMELIGITPRTVCFDGQEYLCTPISYNYKGVEFMKKTECDDFRLKNNKIIRDDLVCAYVLPERIDEYERAIWNGEHCLLKEVLNEMGRLNSFGVGLVDEDGIMHECVQLRHASKLESEIADVIKEGVREVYFYKE